MSAPKGHIIKFRPQKDDLLHLNALSASTGLAQVDVTSMLLHAALNAVEAEGHQISFPLCFKFDKEGSARRAAQVKTETAAATPTASVPSSTPRKRNSPRYQQAK